MGSTGRGTWKMARSHRRWRQHGRIILKRLGGVGALTPRTAKRKKVPR